MNRFNNATTLEPYNFVCSMGELLQRDNCMMVPYTNEQLYKNCSGSSDQPGYAELNKLVVRNYRTMMASRLNCDTSLYTAKSVSLIDFKLTGPYR